jgi:hypothetical protein
MKPLHTNPLKRTRAEIRRRICAMPVSRQHRNGEFGLWSIEMAFFSSANVFCSPRLHIGLEFRKLILYKK